MTRRTSPIGYFESQIPTEDGTMRGFAMENTASQYLHSIMTMSRIRSVPGTITFFIFHPRSPKLSDSSRTHILR
jgi:hypothetical protein